MVSIVLQNHSDKIPFQNDFKEPFMRNEIVELFMSSFNDLNVTNPKRYGCEPRNLLANFWSLFPEAVRQLMKFKLYSTLQYVTIMEWELSDSRNWKTKLLDFMVSLRTVLDFWEVFGKKLSKTASSLHAAYNSLQWRSYSCQNELCWLPSQCEITIVGCFLPRLGDQFARQFWTLLMWYQDLVC